ncbi:MAG: hypothetical protein QF754_02675 [Alphaproteobacteria bacterium]|jgi:hypothetical protein|nr:hypothetical protein [Alphaproteobacteria bacterium]
MAERRKFIAISERTAAAWWQWPDEVWRKWPLLQRIRLRHTMADHVLPLLGKLEDLYLKQNMGAKPRLSGRTLEQVETDDVAIEAGLYLFDLAVSEGLLIFAESVGKSGIKRNDAPEWGAIGSCGLSIDAVKRHYLHMAAGLIMEKAGHDAAEHRGKFESLDLEDPANLAKFRLLVKLDPVSVRELSKGLKGHLEKLMEAEDEYLEILHKVSPIKFLRALRYGLGDQFPRIVEWSPEFIAAVAEGLDHSAKITAIGETLMLIEDPEVVRALGTWEVKETDPTTGKGGKKRRNYTTRIEQVKKHLGMDFPKLLLCGPEVVEEAGRWKNDEIERIKFYLPHLTLSVLEQIKALDFEQKVGLLEGLWAKLGREFVESDMHDKQGLKVLHDIVVEIGAMKERGTAPEDLGKVIEDSDMFDKFMGRFLKRR